MLFILNVALLKLSLSSDNTQLLDHDQVKSRDLQKLLKCFHGIITFVFKDGTGDLGGWSSSPSFLPFADLSSVFPLFLSYV